MHHVVPSSQRPDLFFASDNLAAACQACNSGGGRRVGLENQQTNLLQIAGAFEQISQRLNALSERVAELERATGHTQSNDQALPTSRPVPASTSEAHKLGWASVRECSLRLGDLVAD